MSIVSRVFKGRPVAVAAAAGALLYIPAAAWVVSFRVGKLADKVREGIENNTEAPPDDPLVPGYRGDPGEAFDYPFDEVMIATPLGDAPAWFVPGSCSTWAITVHGLGGRREEGLRHLSVFHPAGIPTLLITYRNDDGAPADPTGMYGFGLTEWRDLDAAVAYALAHGATNVILDGESMGGAIIGQFLTHSQHVDRVAALILDCPAVDMLRIATDAVTQFRLPLPGPIARLGLGFADRRYPVPLGQARSLDTVAAFEKPLFLAHGDQDELVPITSSETLVARRHAPTVFLRTHAKHIHSWSENPAQYRKWLKAFLATVLPSS